MPDSPLLARLREAERRARDMDARERSLERELSRVEDLRRQAETARRRREAAEAERDEEARRAIRLEAEVTRAESRAANAEARLAERRQEAEHTAAESTAGEPSDDWLAAHEALLGELEAVRAHREDLLRQVEEQREGAERDRQAIARLSTALAEAGGRPLEDEAGDDAEPPATVLEAVERAADRFEHLTFTRSAFESAADSPFRRPADILDALERLDRLGALYADPSGFGTSLAEAATGLGLTWRSDVSELARNRHPDRYTAVHDGARLDLGPHVAIGSGSGAGFIARIYLHVADGSGDVPRGLYVGHVGRHLPRHDDLSGRLARRNRRRPRSAGSLRATDGVLIGRLASRNRRRPRSAGSLRATGGVLIGPLAPSNRRRPDRPALVARARPVRGDRPPSPRAPGRSDGQPGDTPARSVGRRC